MKAAIYERRGIYYSWIRSRGGGRWLRIGGCAGRRHAHYDSTRLRSERNHLVKIRGVNCNASPIIEATDLRYLFQFTSRPTANRSARNLCGILFNLCRTVTKHVLHSAIISAAGTTKMNKCTRPKRVIRSATVTTFSLTTRVTAVFGRGNSKSKTEMQGAIIVAAERATNVSSISSSDKLSWLSWRGTRRCDGNSLQFLRLHLWSKPVLN